MLGLQTKKPVHLSTNPNSCIIRLYVCTVYRPTQSAASAMMRGPPRQGILSILLQRVDIKNSEGQQ
jgi:hypothetical protein